MERGVLFVKETDQKNGRFMIKENLKIAIVVISIWILLIVLIMNLLMMEDVNMKVEKTIADGIECCYGLTCDYTPFSVNCYVTHVPEPKIKLWGDNETR